MEYGLDVSYQSMTRVCSFFLSCSSEAALLLAVVPVVVASAASVPAMFMSPASSSLTSSSLSPLSLISIVTRRALRQKRAADTVRDSLSSPGVRGPPRAKERRAGVSSLAAAKTAARQVRLSWANSLPAKRGKPDYLPKPRLLLWNSWKSERMAG
jgi:hypothetical protein